MFVVIGAMLAVYGLLTAPDLYRASLGININLVWGLCLLCFGALMLFMGRRRAARG